MSDTQPNSTCHACDRPISPKAQICAECGTRQNDLWRKFGWVIAIASGFSVVISALTVAVTFYPQAMALFVPPKLELYQVETFPVRKRHSSEPDRERLEFSVANVGRTDLFLSRVIFKPQHHSTLFRAKNYVVNQSIKQGENYIIRMVVDKPPVIFQPMTDKAFEKFTQNMTDLKGRACLTFRLNPADPHSPVEHEALVFTQSLMPVKAVLAYSSVSTSGQLVEDVQELEVTAIRLQKQNAACKK